MCAGAMRFTVYAYLATHTGNLYPPFSHREIRHRQPSLTLNTRLINQIYVNTLRKNLSAVSHRAQDRCSDYRARITSHVTRVSMSATPHFFLHTTQRLLLILTHARTESQKTTYTAFSSLWGEGRTCLLPRTLGRIRITYKYTYKHTNECDEQNRGGGHNFVHIHTAGRGNPRLYISLDTYTDTHSLSLRRAIALD